MSINFAVILILLQSIFWGCIIIDLDFIPDFPLSGICKFMGLFSVIPAVINYFTIFYKKKYERIMVEYEYSNGKYLSWYIVVSFLGPIAAGAMFFGVEYFLK